MSKSGETFSDASLLGKRDAFHCYAILTQSPEDLKPGDKVEFTYNRKMVIKSDYKNSDGFVDPYLKDFVPAFTVFWMYINPDIIEDFHHSFRISGESSDEPEPYYESNCTQMGCNAIKINKGL